jgi:DNA repair protein RecN (Recombination protein N)
MLERLRVRDLAIVEDALLEFDPALNVLTGETGAGKSLLVEAVSLLVGGRADGTAVRSGASAAVIEGEFSLAGSPVRARVDELVRRWGWEWDGSTAIVRREVSAEGRSRGSVNHSPATLAALRALGEILVDIHGQHEHQSLLRPDAALLLLDRDAGLEDDRLAYAERLAAWRGAEERRAALYEELRAAADQAGYLAHALQEIESARLREGEEEELRAETDRRRHAERLRELVSGACARLAGEEGAAEMQLAAALRALEQAVALDPTLAQEAGPLAEARIVLSEAARALERYLDRLEGDPGELQALEDRRALLAHLQRKYRRAIGELVAWAGELRARLARHESGEELLRRGDAECEALAADCLERAARLSARRRAAVKGWSARVARELRPLGLARAHLELELGIEEDPGGQPWRDGRVRLGPQGMDRAQLQFSANPGEPPRPLARIASGGELARVMLALKSAAGGEDRVDLMLFDEVDSGIGGAVAQAVGERLRRLSRHRQVLCVTHLPIIAAQATRQFRVSKEVRGGRTLASAITVEGDERVEEIARMLAGDLASATTRRQARELLAATPAARA